MSTALVNCPNCGSISSQTSTPDEYVCSHCNAKFKFVRPGDQTVIHDGRTHYCLLCKGPVEATKMFGCIYCNRSGLCENCVSRTPKGYACEICIPRAPPQEEAPAEGLTFNQYVITFFVTIVLIIIIILFVDALGY